MPIETNKSISTENHSRIALILVEALFYGDKKAAKRWGITTRTIRNYWYQLESNEQLSAIFHDAKVQFEGNWAKNIPGTIISGIEFIAEATREADYKDAGVILAISNAIKTLAEIGLTKDLIDARLADYNRANGNTDSAVVATPNFNS